jgi:hypothetical protein
MRTGTRFVIAIIALIVVMQVPMALALTNTTPVSGGVPVQTPSGFTATVDFGQNAAVGFGSSQLFRSNSKINVSSQNNGGVVVTSSNPGSVDIGQVTGSRTVLTSVNVTQTTATINPSDKSAVELSGAVDAFSYAASHTADDGSADFRLGTSGQATIVVRDSGLAPNSEFNLIGTSGEPVTGSVSVDGSGDATISVSGSESVRDVNVISDAAAPTLTDFTPSGAVSGPTVDFSVNVSDSDLQSNARNDSVTVEISTGGTTLTTDTLTRGGEITASTAPSASGEIDVQATATDDFGETTTAVTTIETPDELVIRNQSAPNQLVNNTTSNVSVEFIGQDSGQVFTRTTSTGRIDMTGLPVDEPFIVRVEAPGFATTRVQLQSLLSQSEVFLLPTSAQNVEIRFDLNDNTGQFPAKTTTIAIEQILQQNGTTEYKRVAADEFGASQSRTFTLEQGSRFRVRIRNQDGEVRELGSITAGRSKTVPLDVGELQFGVSDKGLEEGRYQANATRTNNTLTFVYQDPASETDSIEVQFVQSDNQSVVVATSSAGQTDSFKFSHQLQGDAQNESYIALFEVSRNGAVREGSRPFGAQQFELGSGLDTGWKQIFGVGMLIVVGALFSVANARIGALVVPGMAGVLFYAGWLSGVASGGAVVIALALGVGYNLAVTRGVPT